ncbi:methyltransferase domain-containing protein [Ferruginibacter sp. HRS2-29]|uniref:methyltransferase domain-containing protein n=1 Tax=Ferruginibacter sp. HRS2-29 TaxID=2487334 RepID=UPI0020CCD5C8|nr:methyltransferase domain-containing protein [Ferruginibacter sp. HRS2-29]MCP9753128.1 methyltransferase domain-containing protein [Ferruginibacter sp. HRS2-29]
MSWNPSTYNQFKEERFLPFYDLLSLLDIKPDQKVLDLGCGTGELTRKLADALPGSTALGIDSSAEMLEDATAFAGDSVKFEQQNIQDITERGEHWDIIFSNAAIQWVDGHEDLLPEIIRQLHPNGQLLIQMPAQQHNLSNKLLNELAAQEPYRSALSGWIRKSPVLDIEQYARILFENGGTSINVFEKVYPLVLPDPEALFTWVSGTALIPYKERLHGEIQQQFIADYKLLLERHFTGSPVFYAFRRILMKATF